MYLIMVTKEQESHSLLYQQYSGQIVLIMVTMEQETHGLF